MIDANQFITQNTTLPQFYQYPLFLLELTISSTAKLVYILLYDRVRVSMLNGWQAGGRVYVIYPAAEIAKRLHRSETCVRSSMTELEQCGLLERKSGGFAKPNLLFLKLPEPGSILQENLRYDRKKTVGMDASFLAPNKVIESNNKSHISDRLFLGRYENVILTREEYNSLKRDYPDRLEPVIESMSSYLASSGKQYRSYEAAVRSWMVRSSTRQEKADLYNKDIPFEEGSSL